MALNLLTEIAAMASIGGKGRVRRGMNARLTACLNSMAKQNDAVVGRYGAMAGKPIIMAINTAISYAAERPMDVAAGMTDYCVHFLNGTIAVD